MIIKWILKGYDWWLDSGYWVNCSYWAGGENTWEYVEVLR